MDRAGITELFVRLARISSPSRKERRIADFLKARLLEFGLDVFEDDTGIRSGGDAGNIIARWPGESGGEPICLCAHMDTVQPTEGLEPVVDETHIRTGGRTILGADDKAGITAILAGLLSARQSGVPHPDIEIVFTVQEETWMSGSRLLDLVLLRSKLCFVLDSGGSPGHMVSETPALYEVQITVQGRAAHAGVDPGDGVNAIWVASRALARLPVGQIDADTVLNIGQVQGGTSTSAVPDQVTLKGELRSYRAHGVDALLRRVEQTFQRVASQAGARTEVSFRPCFTRYALTEKDEVVRVASEALRRAGLEPQLTRRGGGSDANSFNERGLNSVNLGVGMEADHTSEENVAIDDLIRSARFVASLITGR